MEQIVCKDAMFAYNGEVVVKKLSFEVNRGNYLCIVGENGSGKSTLVKGLLGLIKLQGGSIAFGDGLRPTEIGYLPQQSDAQKDFPASVLEVVLSGCLNQAGYSPFFTKAARELALSNMRKLGVEGLKKKSYRALSGGQQQRVLLARALCATKSLILLDEPVTGLDPTATLEFYRLIEQLNRREGITVIMVSHDIASALRYATHILHLHGENGFFGETEEYRQCDICQNFLSGGAKRVYIS